MNGTYYIYSGSELLAVSENVVTDEGREAILRFLAGERNSLADHMVFGIGETAALQTDILLDFEYHRDDVDLKQANQAESQLVIRGRIPDEKTFDIYEIGLMLDENTMDTEVPNNLITTFDSNDEATWRIYDGASFIEEGFEYVGGRTDGGGFHVDVPSNETRSLVRDGSFGSFENLPSDDEFALAYDVLSGSATTIEVRFRLDESNYRSYSFTPGTGFNVQRWKKSDFVQTGSAGWDEMESLEVVVTAGELGADVLFDGLRYDAVSGDERAVLVSRTVLTTPVPKRSTSEVQIEYVLNVAFSVNGA